MTGTYRYSPAANRKMAQVHRDTADAVTAAYAVAPESLQSTQGPISYAADTATIKTGRSRTTAYQALADNSQQISDLLGQAATAYERGDKDAADRLRAQAQQLEHQSGSPAGGSPGGASASTGTPTVAAIPAVADGGAGSAGQLMGSMAQLAGQMMQGITQPLQGAAQSLSQIPQQAVQGVQGMVQAATQGAGAAGLGGAEEADMAGRDMIEKEPGKKDSGKDDDKDGKPDGKKHGERTPVGGARGDAQPHARNDPDHAAQQAGDRANAGLAPKPATDRGGNAPVRPM